jgi:hypothetical protein
MNSVFSRREALIAGASLLAATTWTGSGLVLAQQTDETVIGTVTRIQSNGVAMQNAFPRILEKGSEIMLGDVISTSKGARLEFTTLDGGIVTLGESTIFIVMEYVMSQSGGNIVMQLMEGAFLATSGTMNKLADNTFNVETPFATIGIRGTTVWGGTLSDTFEVALIDGMGVTVDTYGGRVELDKVGQGTKIPNRKTPPSNPTVWGETKIDKAKATVTFN